MNALSRAKNVWKRCKAGKVGLIDEMARALAEAHQQGFREGAVRMLDRATKVDIDLNAQERTQVLLGHFYTVTGLKRP